MARDVTGAMADQLTAAILEPILLAKLEFDVNPLRAWSGLGDLVFEGETYTGLGTLAGVRPGAETTALRAPGATFTLTGIPASIVTRALTVNYQDRPATLWLGALDPAGGIVVNPLILFRGRMDIMTVDDGAESSTISISAESRLIDLEIPRLRRYTPEDQAARFPTDTGFDYIATLQETEIRWEPGSG